MTNPFEQFGQWLEDAKRHPGIIEPTAMTLATATKNAAPSARIVLLKGWDERGFAFYTNMESRKSAELKQNPQAALCFYWMPLERQVRIEGRVEVLPDDEADKYFAERPRESRVGAWSSRQSQPLESREFLMAQVEANMKKFEGQDVKRPPFWAGWRVVPHAIEFWQQGAFRLHDRFVHSRQGGGWVSQRLYP